MAKMLTDKELDHEKKRALETLRMRPTYQLYEDRSAQFLPVSMTIPQPSVDYERYLRDANPQWQKYDPFNDPKLKELSPNFAPIFLQFWYTLHNMTTHYNQSQNTAWNWRINNIRRPRSRGLHRTGNAVDINLYWNDEPVPIQPRRNPKVRGSEYFPDPQRLWMIVDLLRRIAKYFNLEWGGLYRNYWDPAHIENQPYDQLPRLAEREAWWESIRYETKPTGGWPG